MGDHITARHVCTYLAVAVAVDVNALKLFARWVCDHQVRVVVMNPLHFDIAILFPSLQMRVQPLENS